VLVTLRQHIHNIDDTNFYYLFTQKGDDSNAGTAVFAYLQQGCYTVESNGLGYLPNGTASTGSTWQFGSSPRKRKGRDRNWDDDDSDRFTFHHAVRSFCVDGKSPARVLLSVAPKPDDGKMRVVLSWNSKPLDLDLSVMFQTKNKLCTVTTTSDDNDCGEANVNVVNTKGGDAGADVITFSVKETTYQFWVHKYSTDVPAFYFSGAQVDVYMGTSQWPIASLNVPTCDPNKKDSALSFTWWNAFCVDGATSQTRVLPQNLLAAQQSSVVTSCGGSVVATPPADKDKDKKK